MAFCPQCGKSTGAGEKFCSSCGAALTPIAVSNPGPGGAAVPATPSLAQVERVIPRIKTSVPDFVKEALLPGEPILGAFSASLFDQRRSEQLRHDKFVLTPTRIIYYHTALIHKELGEMPYKTITGVSFNKGLMHGEVIVEAANAGLTMRGIGNDDAAFAERIIADAVRGTQIEVETV